MAEDSSSPDCHGDEPVTSDASLPDSSGAVTSAGRSGGGLLGSGSKRYADVQSDRHKTDLGRIDDYAKAFVDISASAVADMKGVKQDMRYISPEPLLPILAKHWGLDPHSEAMAKKLDSIDKLGKFRKYFSYPMKKNCIRVDKTNLKPDEECVYFCSNLVGLKPKTVDGYVQEMLQAWANWGVWLVFEGRFAGMTVDQKPTKSLEKIVGARAGEVTLMNGCTVNLHFLLIHFYQPTETRYKIICEENPFSSDTYCFKSQLRMHGIDPDRALVMVRAREGEAYLRHEDILDAIAKNGQQTAVVCFGGVHFLTGQKFDMVDITRAAHEQGCICGFDLAHAVGNVEMHLHRWKVDFAVWTNYKYMAGGQGAIGGAFIHKMHWDRSAPRLEGWWGSKVEKRFLPGPEVDPSLGAGAFRISMCSMWNTVPLFASTEIYDKTCMRSMERKRFWYNGFFDSMLEKLNKDLKDTFGDKSGLLAIPDPKVFNVVTPRDPDERGNQTTLSMKFPRPDVIYADLTKHGFIMDYKRPNVFRISPHMLYNTFHELFLLVDFLRKRTFEHLSKMAPAYREGMETG